MSGDHVNQLKDRAGQQVIDLTTAEVQEVESD